MTTKYLDSTGLTIVWQKIKLTFSQLGHTHTKSEITDFPSTMTPSSHTHGNIQNGGTLQTTDVSIANGDKLVVTDSSSSNQVARTSVSFDGSTTTQALTKKGTWESFAPTASPSFTGTPTAPTATTGTNTTQIATTAFVKTAVESAVSGGAAYQGTVPLSGGGFAPTNYTAGWYWIVQTAGTYAGEVCEAGDMIFCSTTASTYSASNFDVIQTNLDIGTMTSTDIDNAIAAA